MTFENKMQSVNHAFNFFFFLSARFERADQGPSRRKLSKVPRLIGNTYPDASDWSIDDVVHFFTSAGFSEQALAFRDQVNKLSFCLSCIEGSS